MNWFQIDIWIWIQRIEIPFFVKMFITHLPPDRTEFSKIPWGHFNGCKLKYYFCAIKFIRISKWSPANFLMKPTLLWAWLLPNKFIITTHKCQEKNNNCLRYSQWIWIHPQHGQDTVDTSSKGYSGYTLNMSWPLTMSPFLYYSCVCRTSMARRGNSGPTQPMKL